MVTNAGGTAGIHLGWIFPEGRIAGRSSRPERCVMRDIQESDWKVFKELHPVALERYFMRAVAGMQRKLGNARLTNRERFWEVVEQAREDQKEVRETFDDYRRSTAVIHLMIMRREGLIKEEEMARFSEDLQERMKMMLSP